MHELIVTTLTDSIMTTQTTAYCMTHLSRKAITMGGIMRMGAGRTILVITVSRTALSHTYTQREREINCYSTLPRTGLNQRSISDIHRGLSNNRMSYFSCATNDAYPLSSNLRSANNFSLSIFHLYSFSQFMSSHKESINGRGTCCTTNTHTHTTQLA